MKYFSPEFRTASVVPRWSIVWTLTRDTVANHSFFVTVYAEQIGHLIGWSGNGGSMRGMLMFMALTHDLDETITGDIVAPAKHAILDSSKADQYIDKNMRERLPYVVEQDEKWHARNPTAWHEAKLIVKAADRLDALLFLVVEKRLGNSVIAPRIPECMASLLDSWGRLPGDPATLAMLWDTHVRPAIDAHERTGGYGI